MQKESGGEGTKSPGDRRDIIMQWNGLWRLSLNSTVLLVTTVKYLLFIETSRTARSRRCVLSRPTTNAFTTQVAIGGSRLATLGGFTDGCLLGTRTLGAAENTIFAVSSIVGCAKIADKLGLNGSGVNAFVVKELFDVFSHLGYDETNCQKKVNIISCTRSVPGLL
jgi:hypothetical protein